MKKYKYESSEWDILEAMITYGGSFVKKLAELYRLADDDNRHRLESAFHEYFIKYDEISYRTTQDEKI